MSYFRSYHVGHVGQSEPITFKRTLEYIDLRGAPWIIKTIDNSGSARSVAYQHVSLISADTLESIIQKIDNTVNTNNRTKFSSSSTYYSQTPIRDSLDFEWEVQFITGNIPGYYAIRWGALVGPANNKTELKSMIDRYNTRVEGEKSVITRDSVQSMVVNVNSYSILEVPQEVKSAERSKTQSTVGRLVVIGSLLAASLYVFVKTLKT